MVKLTVYGYRLGEHKEVEFLPFKRCLMRPEAQGNAIKFLRPTMANLLEFLLANAVGEIVPDKTLQIQVWEKNGLSCSSQRLWQVMNNLKRKLAQVGLSDDFILRITGQGYMIAEEKVLELYCKERPYAQSENSWLPKQSKTNQKFSATLSE
ncbi:winged helix family transcriptional regulator [Metakosakonia massiliensis]|uniref:OmpR/PhoB-type domain-containing protein n=1 Tax=Phytobacter massiliensis TaxID=1485952 RepID=A0A6N2ZQE2_9ENTR